VITVTVGTAPAAPGADPAGFSQDPAPPDPLTGTAFLPETAIPRFVPGS